jgi:hypothetical protein
MNDLTELQEIWLSADTGRMPAYKEMMQVITQYRRKNLVKMLLLIAAAIVLTCVMVGLVFFYRSVMITTRVGEALIIMAGLLLVATNIGSVRRLYHVKDHTNKEFAAYLEQVQANRLYYYKRTQVLGLLLSFSGVLFYVYEAVYIHLLWAVITYSILGIYFSIMWFVVRPRAYKRQAAKLEQTIKKMKHLEQQF